MQNTVVAINVPAKDDDYYSFISECGYEMAMDLYGFAIRHDGVGEDSVGGVAGELISNYWETTPIFSETYFGYEPQRDLYATLDAFFGIHVNALTFGNCKENNALFMQANQEMLANTGNNWYQTGLLNMGYRLIPTNVSYNNVVEAGSDLIINTSWINNGVGRLYKKYPLAISIKDENGNIVYKGYDKNFDLTSLTKGNTADITSAFRIPTSVFNFNKGNYSLYLSMVDEQTGENAISFAVNAQTAEKDFYIGNLIIE